ncbi:MAG: hypothetical protein JSR58_06970 [Verrucomicrobia bacterium]|nr:hypothetical protein [Verrucomicrobiota bacterium]
MPKAIVIGGCVKVPDGRIGRVRRKLGNLYVVRVQRKTSKTHQFLQFKAAQLKPVACPKGWMSIQGYNRYLKITLAKMKERKSK